MDTIVKHCIPRINKFTELKLQALDLKQSLVGWISEAHPPQKNSDSHSARNENPRVILHRVKNPRVILHGAKRSCRISKIANKINFQVN